MEVNKDHPLSSLRHNKGCFSAAYQQAMDLTNLSALSSLNDAAKQDDHNDLI